MSFSNIIRIYSTKQCSGSSKALTVGAKGTLEFMGSLWGTAGVELAGITFATMSSPRFPLFYLSLDQVPLFIFHVNFF